jgi:hypothetical protein
LPQSTRLRVRRPATALVLLAVLAGGALASAGAAEAGDLIVLAPDSATISGSLAYDHVYIGDGATLRLAGDTAISAADVYIAGGANLRTCFVAPSDDNGCTTGRNLAIGSTGQLNIGSGINLQAGAGTVRPGGNLVLQGAGITVSGAIDTSGSMGGGSGSVAIASSGAVALSSAFYQASVNAPGNAVSIHGTSISLSGDLDTEGSDPNITSAGPIDVEATTGPLNLHGNVNAYGRGSSGGNGAGVTLRGTDVHVGQIDASAGSSNVGAPGAAGTVDVAGTTSVSTSNVDTSGASGASTFGATGGGNIHIASGGPVLTGNVTASGSNADTAPPSGGGSIVIAGAGVATGQIFTNGGSRSGTSGPGSNGNNVAISSTGALSLGDVEAYGGNSLGDGWAGGAGGSIDIVGDGVITSELRTNAGSNSGTSPGGPAGPIHVTGKSYVSVLGAIVATGGNSSGGAFNPPMTGGPGNTVSLRATAGPLSLGAPIRTGGGNGGNAPNGVKAGSGGAGGSIELVGTPIDPIAGISSEGGDGGYSNSTDTRGTGGAGGTLHAWSETNVFGGLRSVSTAGGSGAPPGVDGAQLLDSGPTALSVDATGLLSFTSQSPYAEGYDVYQSIAGAPATLVLTTRSTSHVAVPPVALCQAVTYDVTAFQSAVGWTSPPTAPVAFLRQPSATQKCSDAPSLSHGTKAVLLKAANLKKHKGVFSFVVQTNGMGAIAATATTKGGKKPIGTAAITAAKAGALKVTIKLDPKAKLTYKKVKGRKIARVSVKLVAAAPTGSSKTSITVSVEVRK